MKLCVCACVIMFEVAENGKAALGTGGVNLLPHMSVFLSYTIASVAVLLAQGHYVTDCAVPRERVIWCSGAPYLSPS